MTEWEVEALLGGPPGDYRTKGCRKEVVVRNTQGLRQEIWRSDEATVVVVFLADGTVTGTYSNLPVGRGDSADAAPR
jgi:hypothetical protein